MFSQVVRIETDQLIELVFVKTGVASSALHLKVHADQLPPGQRVLGPSELTLEVCGSINFNTKGPQPRLSPSRC